MAARSTPETVVHQLVEGWWLVLLFGVASIAAGVIMLVWPGIGIVSLAWVAGIFLLVDGVFELLTALSPRSEGRGMLAILGALSVIAGLFLVRHPIASVAAIALLLGAWFIVMGAVRLVEAFGPFEGQRLWMLLVAVLELIFGIIVVSDVGIGVAALAAIVGIGFILRGLAMVMAGWTLRSLSSARGTISTEMHRA
ncbi:MAG TPA: HdeD family acid-resistance protein [Dehalococcoidia bacterium]|nr:HdeD family acid-resistance protein [Dehalococcoidia bacterium]